MNELVLWVHQGRLLTDRDGRWVSGKASCRRCHLRWALKDKYFSPESGEEGKGEEREERHVEHRGSIGKHVEQNGVRGAGKCEA